MAEDVLEVTAPLQGGELGVELAQVPERSILLVEISSQPGFKQEYSSQTHSVIGQCQGRTGRPEVAQGPWKVFHMT
jgi:hypothetical protein